MTSQVAPRARHRTPARCATVLGGLAFALLLTACSGDSADSGEGVAPEDVLAEARTRLDETSGVRISLATEELPDGIDGVLDATGVGTHAPAFEGEIKVLI